MEKFRSYPVRLCFKLVVTNILGFIGSFIIFSIFSYVPDRPDVWWGGFIKTTVVFAVLLVFACIIINYFIRERIYYINYNEKFIKEGNKIIYYEYATEIKVEKTITHRIFGLVTITIKSPYGKITLKDVPEKIENYIRGKY